MPYRDGTGPLGTGRSGGGLGPCGRGGARGMGGGRGLGAGRGFGGGQLAQAAPLPEKEALQQEAQALEARLAAIKKRSEEIK